MIKNYTHIDYREWIIGNQARNGINIKRLNILNKKELEILNKAIPYQDARNDPGQAEIVAYFSIKLIGYLKGIREVVVPSAILHDIGFYFTNDPFAWKKLVNSGSNTETEAVRRPHQNSGLILAGKILEKVNYPEKYFREIADIIGDHDTRKLPATESGKIVRASDLLWRVTLPCLKSYFPNTSPKEALTRIEDTTFKLPETHKLGDIETKIARLELVNTVVFNFGEKSFDLLKKDYKRELNTIIKYYNQK